MQKGKARLPTLKQVLQFNKTIINIQSNGGQALVTLLFFVIIAITIAASAVVVTVVNTQSTSILEQSNQAYTMAEAGAENALLRLLRDQSYSGETFVLSGININVIVTGSAQKIIISQASVGQFLRKVQVIGTFTNNDLTVQSWKEIL